MKDDLKKYITTLPDAPGIYKYIDKEDTILYIGKARNIKKRVSSYFTKQAIHGKTKAMLNKAAKIEYTVVDNEAEALLLENNLIKEFQPRYNINLKDDKTYPLIRITSERFPRIFPTRNPVDDGSEYFGPYASVKAMHLVLEFVRQLYPTRNCNLPLSAKNIEAGKFSVCLEFQIGNCKGPCVGLESESDYLESIRQIRHILRGKLSEVRNHLKNEMHAAAQELRFEQAELYKNKLLLLEKFQSKSTVAGQLKGNMDVFNLDMDDRFAFVNFLRVVDGIVIQTHTMECKKMLDESPSEILALAITEIHHRFGVADREIVLPYEPEYIAERFQVSIPKAGPRLKLLELSRKNAMMFRKERISSLEKLNPGYRSERLLTQAKNDLRLKDLPHHIECFDNSNMLGKDAVSACVVFREGKPSKKDYRIFNVQTVSGPDDFATMREVIHRRYKRLREEDQPMPQLIIVDGGKGQLSSAVDSLKNLGVYHQVAVIGIAKRLEEIYYPDDPVPIYLDKKSSTLKLIQQMRDEAHRFGITRHRKKRMKTGLSSELEQIEGIGPETIKMLLGEFRSLTKIKQASEQELSNVLGQHKAGIIFKYLHTPSE